MDNQEHDFEALMKKLEDATAVNAKLTEQITALTAANTKLVEQFTKPVDEMPEVEKDAMSLLNEALTGLLDKEVDNGNSK